MPELAPDQPDAAPEDGRPITRGVRALGRVDAWLATVERGITTTALLLIVVVIFLQAILRFASTRLPLADWLDPFALSLAAEEATSAGSRAWIGFQRVLAWLYDAIVRGGGELARYALVWAAVLGASVAARERRHLAVEILPRVLERRGWSGARAWVEVVAALIAALIAAYIAWAGWVLLQSPPIQMRESAALRIPIRWVALALPIGFAIIALRFLGSGITAALVALRQIPESARYAGGGGLQALIAEYGGRAREAEAARIGDRPAASPP